MRVSGPLFDGSAGQIVADAVREIEQQVGQQAERDLISRFAQVLRHPTGRYVSRLHVSEQGGLVRVDDQNSVYGPWLEGTGSRNSSSRFKGYATFRRVRQELDTKARRIADQVIERYVRRLQ